MTVEHKVRSICRDAASAIRRYGWKPRLNGFVSAFTLTEAVEFATENWEEPIRQHQVYPTLAGAAGLRKLPSHGNWEDVIVDWHYHPCRTEEEVLELLDRVGRGGEPKSHWRQLVERWDSWWAATGLTESPA